jgi:hypothetical protein
VIPLPSSVQKSIQLSNNKKSGPFGFDREARPAPSILLKSSFEISGAGGRSRFLNQTDLTIGIPEINCGIRAFAHEFAAGQIGR